MAKRQSSVKHAEYLAQFHGSRGKCPEYKSWRGMKARCFNQRSRFYGIYGGRGITMCSRWRWSFESFLDDMGRRPFEKCGIDRRDNDGNYSCGHCEECLRNGWTANCRWVTQKTNCRNRSNNHPVTLNEQTRTIAEWSDITGLSGALIIWRLRNGWTAERALCTPPSPGSYQREKTHCPSGHEYTPENTRIHKVSTGLGRRCITCDRERDRIRYKLGKHRKSPRIRKQ